MGALMMISRYGSSTTAIPRPPRPANNAIRFRGAIIDESGFALRQSRTISQNVGGMKKTRPKNIVAWCAAAAVREIAMPIQKARFDPWTTYSYANGIANRNNVVEEMVPI